MNEQKILKAISLVEKNVSKQIDGLTKSVSTRFDKAEKSVSDRFDKVGKRFDMIEKSFGERFDKVETAIIENREDINRVLKKVDMNSKSIAVLTERSNRDIRDVHQTLNHIMTILKRAQEDKNYTIDWLQRLDTTSIQHGEDIRVLKLKTGIT